jgi:GPH family glycoside/pentoside/hexuronide:cation symporter
MLVMVMYMNFATDVLRVAPAVMGMIFLASKLWDAVSDPIVGFLSDRTHSRMGRRRSWILGSSLPLALFALMLWTPPEALSELELVAWITVAVFGFYTAYTTFFVPHLALGAELSFEQRDRNLVYGARQIASGIGLLLAFALGAPLLAQQATARATASELASIAGLACLVAVSLAALGLPREATSVSGSVRGARNPIGALRDVWRNPHARLLLFVFFIESFGVAGTTAMAPYVVKYVIQREEVLGLVLLAYLIPTALSIPVWIWLARYFERHRLWRFAMGITAIGYASLAFLDEGRVGVQLFCSIACGTGAGCGNTLGQAIKADVIDYDEYLTGERKEGSYFAVWAFVMKFAGSIMIGIAGLALSWAGYVENVAQTEFVRNTMLWLNGGIPAICFVIGLIAFGRFRLDSVEHARIRQVVAERSP